ncbi:polysaccharide deacetylase family protein [Geomicrobium sediminis]|uniref:Peptidoglycan/xylan/chitin deacetylase (PgdA/CDA1 family) n=1 Tax=Geomicrobium sediminis TaxID=1347788 RepID=A0ABS2P8K1_9BACL|nr:peptidoglycan/xylan/chitin deacetylase (PgdA/CDA1 family) [Geomicrobium sediminis]
MRTIHWLLVICLVFVPSVALAETDDVPPLQGGSEEDERDPDPLTFTQLKQSFPDSFYYMGDPSSQQIALTFDDGPDPRHTTQVLEVLEKYDVPATFFVLGSRAEAYPELLTTIDEQGHDIGSHTFWHPNLTDDEESDDLIGQLDWELTQTEEVIDEIVGYRPRLFRAPYGGLNIELMERLVALDNVAIGWDADSNDWRQIPAEEIVEILREEISPGSIVLMHDGGNWDQTITSAQALDILIPELQSDGYEFVTISDMLDIDRAK